MDERLPVWLLDIDGVVNALARGPVRESWPADTWVQCVIRADMPRNGPMVLPIFAAQPVLDFITRAHESGRVEVRWHSTWRTAAVTELAPVLGLPTTIPISIAPEWTTLPDRTWWKLPAAQRVIASGRRLVWTDDDISVYWGELGDLVGREDALLLPPDRQAGLRPRDVDRIAAFLGLQGH